MIVWVIISGRVTGVGFRLWLRNNAKSLGVSGWVRNKSSRQVEAFFSGDRKFIGILTGRCKKGPPLAKVDRIDVYEYGEEKKGFENGQFNIIQ